MKEKSKLRVVIVILVVGLAVSILANGYLIRKIGDEMRVTGVADGDTLYLKNGAVVRLAGASAPEYNECLGAESKMRLEEIVRGKVVRLGGRGHDTFGRVIARVWVDNLSVEKEMILAGMARIEYAMSTDNADLRAANEKASAEKVGVYGPACTIQPTDERMKSCQVKANIDDSTKKKYYHLPGCPHYDQVVISLDTGDKCFKTEKEAVTAGFMKASGCE